MQIILNLYLNFLVDTIKQWLQVGIVERTVSPWNAAVFILDKKHGDLPGAIKKRVVCDYRQLNRVDIWLGALHFSYPSLLSRIKEVKEALIDIEGLGSTVCALDN